MNLRCTHAEVEIGVYVGDSMKLTVFSRRAILIYEARVFLSSN